MNNKLQNYVSTLYKNSFDWIEKEVNQVYHTQRIGKVFNNKMYLSGVHKVLGRADITFKEKEYITKKIILPKVRTTLNFHSNYLLGKGINFKGSENLIKEIQKVYREGNYKAIDRRLLDKFNKYNDSYEYIYREGKKIKSKIINSECAYPIYNDYGEYIGFIEHWTDSYSKISYYNLYDFDTVESYSNEGSEFHMVDSKPNTSKSLPIHYHNESECNENFGEGLMDSIIPILDEIEDFLSKLGDAVYRLSLNPLSVTTGQQIEGEMNKDIVGYNVALENGSDMKYINATMDYNDIKLYLDKLEMEYNENAYMPSIIGGNTNISNVSETSLKMLYQIADVWAGLCEEVMLNGFIQRYEIIREMLDYKEEDDYISIGFTYNRPQNDTELLNNIKTQFEIGALSNRSIIELSPLTPDSDMELSRLRETKEETSNQNSKI